ncbi:hypothetical protein WICPIJ_001729 [Wickerhamomyces pijperi]|uniref:tRNA (guanine(9)-N1)-methyltransferase n=1 Tax=Wickerhamomyces pijperi TaxID=599730 RepID=A0A9P8TQW0_WICPI|nr:hypothetical protein WICPIJ_001729 [Wickerhamomyces pijperi]
MSESEQTTQAPASTVEAQQEQSNEPNTATTAKETTQTAPSTGKIRQRREPNIPPPELRIKPVIPEGMSKKQWKKEQKHLKFLEQKEEYNKVRKEKKLQARANKRAKIQDLLAKGESIDHLIKKRLKPEDQTKLQNRIIIDCGFDEMMTNEERNSLSTQITRSYSAFKNSTVVPTLRIASFNKKLKERFDAELKAGDYHRWTGVEFDEEELKIDDPEKYVYLSSDATEDLTELSPDVNYVIGGIVDKGRYKNLCYNKSKELGVKSYRLPIDEFIKLSGRRVLTTTHVVELLLKWYELKDWKQAFELVLPQRKQIKDEESSAVSQTATPEPTGN